ncbi:hypothetical protein GS506_02495 [Rhodococcus hoagii]|nr:hypothetical protein [Prescottella equi]
MGRDLSVTVAYGRYRFETNGPRRIAAARTCPRDPDTRFFEGAAVKWTRVRPTTSVRERRLAGRSGEDLPE